ncbi:long-chain fatty acid--CoA ligase [Paradesulfitobacterium aromaticivorans]
MHEKPTYIDQAFRQSVAKRPDHTALIYLGEKYSYAKLDRLVDRVAGSLYILGVRQGERIIIYAPHCPQWVVAWLAIQRLGAVAIPVTHFYGAKDLLYIANDSGAETIFCMDTNFGYVDKVAAVSKLKRIIVTTLVDLLPVWKKAVGRVLDRVPTGKFDTKREYIHTFLSLLQGKDTCPAPSLSAQEFAEMLYTGGTTGYPKGVPISNALLLESSLEQRHTSSNLIPIGEDIVLQGAPLNHILGQVVGFGALFSGETLVLLPKMGLDAVFDHFKRYQVKSFLGTPTVYRMMLEHDRIDHYDLSSLKYLFCAGDVMPQEIANRWLKRFGMPLYQGYGATETCGGVALTRPDDEIPVGTAGKIISFQRVKLVNPDTMKEVAPGEPGELLVSSPNMVRGYWNKPEETAAHFVELDGQLWYVTGDIVRINDEGWLFFMDRSVDIIKHKGYRVAASKVDAVLQEHPAVVEASTVGIPDSSVGERIKSFVVLKNDVKGVSAYELTRWCKERLASYEVPAYIEFRDMLPKSKVGKILRRELRSEERRKLEVS